MLALRNTLHALALAALAAAALADTWGSFPGQRIVDAAGHRYVVLRESEGGCAFEYARRGEGQTAVAAARGIDDRLPRCGEQGADKPVDISVRQGDELIARGRLRSLPMEVLVSSEGHGFAALDSWGGLGRGTAVAIVGADGRVRHEKRLSDLFDEAEIAAFQRSTSSIFWLRGGWLDEAKARVVLVSWGDPRVRVVAFDTGDVSKSGDAEILDALGSKSVETQTLALELVAEKKLGAAAEKAAALLTSADTAFAVRLRAAVALAAGGDLRGKDVIVRASAAPRSEFVAPEERAYALHHLPDVLGTDALPLLREAMRGPLQEPTRSPAEAMRGFADGSWHPAQHWFRDLGEAAVPTLLGMLAETKESSDYRGGACHALRAIGSKKALDPLVAAIAEPVEYVANAAAKAAIAIGGDAIADRLVEHLRRGTTQDGRLGSYFQSVRSRASVPALVAMMERHAADSYERHAAAKALQFQTGKSLGGDPAAWREWLGENSK